MITYTSHESGDITEENTEVEVFSNGVSVCNDDEPFSRTVLSWQDVIELASHLPEEERKNLWVQN